MALALNWRLVKSRLQKTHGMTPLELRLLRQVQVEKIEELGSYVRLIFAVPSFYFKDRLTRYYEASLAESIEAQIQRKVVIHWEIRDGQRTFEFTHESRNPVLGSQVENRFSFANYKIDAFNKVSVQLVQYCSVHPGGDVNPLLICGGSGLGKTHLMRAFKLELESKRPDVRVVLLSGDKYVSEFLDKMKCLEMESFREQLRLTCDVLIIDDFHLMAQSRAAQLELLLTVEDFIHQKKQIVFSSLEAPEELRAKIDERLMSRLESHGMTASIEALTPKMALEVAKFRAHSMGIQIDKNVERIFIARAITNVRQVEALLNRLFVHKKLNSELLQTFLGSEKEPVDKHSVSELMSVVCSAYQISELDLLSPSKKPVLNEARAVVVALLDKYHAYSATEIAKVLKRKNHSSILQMRKKVATTHRLQELASALSEGLESDKDINQLQMSLVQSARRLQ